MLLKKYKTQVFEFLKSQDIEFNPREVLYLDIDNITEVYFSNYEIIYTNGSVNTYNVITNNTWFEYTIPENISIHGKIFETTIDIDVKKVGAFCLADSIDGDLCEVEWYIFYLFSDEELVPMCSCYYIINALGEITTDIEYSINKDYIEQVSLKRSIPQDSLTMNILKTTKVLLNPVFYTTSLILLNDIGLNISDSNRRSDVSYSYANIDDIKSIFLMSTDTKNQYIN